MRSASAREMMVCIWPRKKRALVGLTAPGCASTASSASLSCGRWWWWWGGIKGYWWVAAASSGWRPAPPLVAAQLPCRASLGTAHTQQGADLRRVDLVAGVVLRVLKAALRVADDQLPHLQRGRRRSAAVPVRHGGRARGARACRRLFHARPLATAPARCCRHPAGMLLWSKTSPPWHAWQLPAMSSCRFADHGCTLPAPPTHLLAALIQDGAAAEVQLPHIALRHALAAAAGGRGRIGDRAGSAGVGGSGGGDVPARAGAAATDAAVRPCCCGVQGQARDGAWGPSGALTRG